MTREEAFEILSLSSEANSYEIENRYSILARAYFRDERQESKDKMERINEAYGLLTGKTIKREVEVNPKDYEIIFGRTRKYWKNLIYYSYKPALAILLIVAVLFSIIYTAVTNKHADFDIAYLGSFAKLDEKDINFDIEKILEDKYQLEKVVLNFLPIYDGVDVQSQNAIMMKMSIISAGAQNIDLMVVDRTQFDTYAKRGLFSSLDEYIQDKEIDIDGQHVEKRYAQIMEVPVGAVLDSEPIPIEEEKVYGLEMSDDSLAGLGIYGNSYILTIPNLAKHKDLAIDVLSDIIQENNELLEKFKQKLAELEIQSSIEAAQYQKREEEREKKRQKYNREADGSLESSIPNTEKE